jgi:hypothetical protein
MENRFPLEALKGGILSCPGVNPDPVFLFNEIPCLGIKP